MGNSGNNNPFNAHNELSTLSATISVRFCNSDAFVTISVPKRKGLWPAILLVFQQIDFQVMNATLSTSADADFHCIQAQIPDDTEIDREDLQKRLEDLILAELGIRACRA